MTNTFQIPVLPIPGTVFMANTVLPLYIVEPVYVRMVQDCIENNTPMAIALAEPQEIESHRSRRIRYSPRSICSMGKPMVIQQHGGNTSMQTLVKGVGRVRLLSIVQNLPYPIFEAEYYEDYNEEVDLPGNIVERLQKLLDQWLRVNIPNSIERTKFQAGITELNHVVDYLTMFMVQDPIVKQLMLESSSLYERIQMLNALLKDPNPFVADSSTGRVLKRYEVLEDTAAIPQ